MSKHCFIKPIACTTHKISDSLLKKTEADTTLARKMGLPMFLFAILACKVAITKKN